MSQSLIRHEFYETPQANCRLLFDTVNIEGTVLEPCVGSGAIVRAGVGRDRAWLTNDIDPFWEQAGSHLNAAQEELWRWYGIDNHLTNCPIDWVVTNPPFSLWLDILKLALRTAKIGVAFHLRASVNEITKTGERRTWMHDHPPTGNIWLPRFGYQRSPKTGAWSVDSVICGWFVWHKAAGVPQFIRYAPESTLRALERETPEYRRRMDELMGLSGTEKDRQQQRVRLAA